MSYSKIAFYNIYEKIGLATFCKQIPKGPDSGCSKTEGKGGKF